MARRILAVAIALLAILRHDVWSRDDPTRVLGLPVGLTWHVGFCLAVSLVMVAVVRWGWPIGVDDDEGGGPPGAGAGR